MLPFRKELTGTAGQTVPELWGESEGSMRGAGGRAPFFFIRIMG